MSSNRGCLKTTLFGCLGIIVLIVVLVGIVGLMAWNRSDERQVENQELIPTETGEDTGLQAAEFDLPVTATGRGRIVLDLKQGAFEIMRAMPGDGVSIEAEFDSEVYELLHSFECEADSSWVYEVHFRRTIGGLQALFRHLLGAGHDPKVHIYVPDDVPIELDVSMEEGELIADLGGMWLTLIDFECSKGGVEISVDDPLREPVERMSLHARMGGFVLSRAGNASPRLLEVDCSMGGADIDLRGQWLRDCDVGLKVSMGGMAVSVPDDVEVQGLDETRYDLRNEASEVALPVLRMSVSESMGEIDILR